MILFFLYLVYSIQGVRSVYNYHLVRTNSYNMIPNTVDYGLLDINGGTVYYGGVHSKPTTLNWMCRMLGYLSYNAYTYNRNYEWMQNYPVRYLYLDCTGSVVPQCRYQEANNYQYYPYSLWLRCNARTKLGDSTSFYLMDKDKQHTQKGHGLLMYNGGTVSGSKFDDTTAEVICRIMGYDRFLNWSIGRKYKIQETLPIRYKDLNCLNSGDVFPVCVYGTDTTAETHDNDIWLWCALPKFNTFNLVCPPGQKRVSSNTCIQCTANTYSQDPSESSSCLSCPNNSTSEAGSTFCSCEEGTYMNSDGNKCLNCPTNSTSMKGSTFCTCPGGTYLYSDYTSCVQCPFGTSSQHGSMSPNDCIHCPKQSLNDGKACSCEKGYGWEWTAEKAGSCKACPSNFYKHKDQGICRRCPHEATSLPLSDECMCPDDLSWDGESCVDCHGKDVETGVCTCAAGTFWNEDSSNCEPCPENFFSGKFFSLCSKCPMYTVSDSNSAECTSCPKGYSWENYTCSVCPKHHVGNGATCSICPEGTTPSEDKTICQKPSVDIMAVSSLAFCALIIAIVIGQILFTCKERRKRITMENLQLVYRSEPDSSTMSSHVGVKGRRCMCPACPCSEVPKPPLPERGATLTLQQDDIYANYS